MICTWSNRKKWKDKKSVYVQIVISSRYVVICWCLLQDDLEKQLRRRIELQAAHATQMRLKAERGQAQRDEEQRFREEMLAKFAEDDRLEQMNAQKRRMKQLEHRRAVERLIEERRRQFQMEKEAELDARREEERMELLRREIIEQERQKLLKEHAAHLLGYLPKVQYNYS